MHRLVKGFWQSLHSPQLSTQVSTTWSPKDNAKQVICTELVSSLRGRLNILNKSQVFVNMYAEKFEKTNVLSVLPLLFSKQLLEGSPLKRWFLPHFFSAYFNKTCTFITNSCAIQYLVTFLTLYVLKQMLVCLC